MTTPDTASAPRLLTVRETAAALKICEKSLWILRRDGRLPAVKIGRAVRFDAADVAAFIASSKEIG